MTDVSASMYDRKTAVRPFDTIHVILRTLRLAYNTLRNRRVKADLRDNVFYTGVIHIVAGSVRFDRAELKLERRENEVTMRADAERRKPKEITTPPIQPPPI